MQTPLTESATGAKPKSLAQLITAARKGDHSAAEEIANYVRRIDIANVDDSSLQDIASLLESSDGTVRLWAAGAIGHFGSRATPFAPRLQEMVSEESCNMTGISAADTAHFALKRMGIEPQPFGCAQRPEQPMK